MTFLWSLLASIVSFLVIVGILFVIGWSLYRSKVAKKDKVLVKDAKRVVFDNAIGEKKAFQVSLKEEHELTLKEVKDSLEVLIDDEKIEEVILAIDDLDLTAAQVAELEPYFERLRQNKLVVAYATHMEMSDYLTALLADKIYLLNSASTEVSLTGPLTRTPYYKQLFDKMGLKWHVLHVGAYKGTGEEYSLEEMSPERKQSIEEIQEQTMDLYVSRVSKRRGKSIREGLISGDWYMMSAEQALSEDLVDGLVDYMAIPRQDERDTVSLYRYHKELEEKELEKEKDTLVVLPLHGTISENERNINDASLKKQLQELDDLEQVKGVILHIDSPGGSALESEKMYQRLKALNLPIYVSMGRVAASGGYYLASAGEKIFATDATLTGSIGVVLMFPEVSEAMTKLGVHTEEAKQGEFATLDVTQALDESVKTKLQNRMTAVYQEFKDRVKAARQMTEEELEPLAGGRVYLGERAQETGLVDHIGTLDDAITRLAEDLHLQDYQVETIYRKQELTNTLTAAIGAHAIALEQQLQLLDLSQQVSLYEPLDD